MFQNMPLPVVKKLRVACSAQGIVASERQALAMSLFDDGMPHHSAPMYEDTLPAIDAMWETASVGACRRDLCPKTGRRRRHFTNTAFLKWTGIHPEEWFTRIQNRELELFLTEYELLQWVMDEIACGHEGVTVRVRRHRHRPGMCLFVRTTTTRVFDVLGRLVRLEHACAPLRVEDLDEVLETHPDMVQITYMGSGSSYADAGAGRGVWHWCVTCSVEVHACIVGDRLCPVHAQTCTMTTVAATQAHASTRKRSCQASRAITGRARSATWSKHKRAGPCCSALPTR